MSVKFACVTCTGDRPLPLSICHRYLRRSTILPDVWLIVDDGHMTSPAISSFDELPSVELKYIRRVRTENEPRHTLPLNVAVAIQNLPAFIEWVVFWEDDDWYSPSYLEWVMKTIEENPQAVLIGQSYAHYYRVMSREYQILGNDKHASLCATAMHRSLLPRMQQLCAQSIDPFLDIHIWNESVTQGRDAVLEKHPHVVGIKEMPGRSSTTYGWRGGPDFEKDSTGAVLRQWVGAEDAAVYLELSNKER